MIMSKWPVIV